MNTPVIEIPFVWPDSRKLAETLGPEPDIKSVIADSQLVLGIVHGITDATVSLLADVLAKEPIASDDGNGRPAAGPPEKQIRLIVTLYPTCPTSTEALQGLSGLQHAHSSLQVKIITCDLLSARENALACYKTPDVVPTLFFGSSATLEDLSEKPTHMTLGFVPEPVLAAEWANAFDVRWFRAVRLTDERTAIPHLVLPEGSIEAAETWAAYERLCVEKQAKEEIVEVIVDPDTGEVSAKAVDGTAVTTVSSDNKIRKVSRVYRTLQQLLDMGHLVSVDKTTRLLPFEVPVKPKWFGLETLKQIGSVKRHVSYRISALTEEELNRLETRRKKTSELLDLFSFSLADGQRWMPSSAEELFRQQTDHINREAKGALAELVSGDLDKFLATRRKSVSEDANRMYGDLFPDHNLPEDAIDEIMLALKDRFKRAEARSFLPQLSFTRVSLPQPQDTAWKSQLGSALNLLLSIVRYPRKACRNRPYFARGMTAKPQQILAAMNVLNDPFIDCFEKYESRDIAEAELERTDDIQVSDDTAEEKCEQLLELLRHRTTAHGRAALEG